MIILNLISPTQKRELKKRQIYLVLENFLAVLLIFSIVYAVIVIPINQSIIQLNEEKNNKKQEIELKNKSITQKINELNKQIKNLYSIQNNLYNWTNYYIKLGSLVPEGLILFEISNSQETKVFKIKGYAKNRDSLIQLKLNLEKSNLYKKINIPLSNFLTAQEITFEISGMLN
jgi:Tfp pilus assembly protein PilN